MTVKQKAEEYLQSIEGDDCVIITDRKERKQAFIDGYKECEKEKEECQKFIWESVGFKKRGFVNSIQIADYIEKLEKENTELKKELKDANEKVVHLACNQNKDLKYKLTKAKELIENIIRVTWGEGWNYSLDWKVKAEQFLTEIEK